MIDKSGFFAEIKKKSNLKFIWNLKGAWIAKMILKKDNIGGHTLSDLKTYYKATLINTVWWFWHKAI